MSKKLKKHLRCANLPSSRTRSRRDGQSWLSRSSGKTCVRHEWVVFSTALAEGRLMLQCVECGSHGVIEDPTETEWSRAFHAPSKPYLWEDESRVVVTNGPSARCYVARASRLECECYSRRGIIEPQRYERLPAEILNPRLVLHGADPQELQAMAQLVLKADLCSLLFAVFIQCAESDGVQVPGEAVQEAARRLAVIDGKGLHCSPGVVSRMLIEFSKGEQS